MTRAAGSVMLVTVILLALSRVLLPPQEWRPTMEYLTAAVGNALLILACAAVGFLIIWRRPGNAIGWVYALVALAFAAAEFTGSYASRTLPGRVWAALLPDLLWVAGVPLGTTLLLLLFPTGRLPSPRWRLVVWAATVATVAVVVASALLPGEMEYLPGSRNPLGMERAGPLLDLLTQVAFVVITVALFAAAGSLIVRWRRAHGVERQQLKWLAYAAVVLVVLLLVSDFLPHGLFVVVVTSMALLFPLPPGSRWCAIGCMTSTGSSTARWCWPAHRPARRYLRRDSAGPWAGVRRGRRESPQLGGGWCHPGRRRAVLAGPPSHPAGGGPPLQPPPV